MLVRRNADFVARTGGIGRDTEDPGETSGKCGKADELFGSNEQLWPAARFLEHFGMNRLRRCQTEIDDIHFVLGAPVQSLNHRLDSRSERAVEDFHGV